MTLFGAHWGCPTYFGQPKSLHFKQTSRICTTAGRVCYLLYRDLPWPAMTRHLDTVTRCHQCMVSGCLHTVIHMYIYIYMTTMYIWMTTIYIYDNYIYIYVCDNYDYIILYIFIYSALHRSGVRVYQKDDGFATEEYHAEVRNPTLICTLVYNCPWGITRNSRHIDWCLCLSTCMYQYII